MNKLLSLQPDIIHMEGNALVPAKSVCYKRDKDGKIIEVIKPRTHQFENNLKGKIKSELTGVSIFPTKKEVFISITHWINSKTEYNSLDLDNRAKSIMDALKGVVYDDDMQVKILITDKHFLKNHNENYFIFSVKILNTRTEKLLLNNLARVRP